MTPEDGNAAEYWRQHAALKTQHFENVEKVHIAFQKYMDHIQDQAETDRKKKLRYLLSYVQLCASVLSEDASTHAPRELEELDKVYKYIVKIVTPYLKKLQTANDRREQQQRQEQEDRQGARPHGIDHGRVEDLAVVLATILAFASEAA